MKRDRLLWVDDEISLLRPHILFLEGKGYEVDTVTNGQDALDRCRATTYDLIFLDRKHARTEWSANSGINKRNLPHRPCYHDHQE